MLTWLLIVILLSAFPIGYFLAWLCRDELVAGRKWFIIIALAGLISNFYIAFASFSGGLSAILTLFYLAIICFVAVWKSYDRKFVKN